MKKNRLIIVLCVLVLVSLLAGVLFQLNRPREQEHSSEEFLMDTLVSISTYGTDTTLLRQATAEAFREMRRLADLTDRFTDDNPSGMTSDIMRINDMAGKGPVIVDPDVFHMLRMAKEYYALTDGAFDITIGPVMDLWGFGKPEQKLPTVDDLREALSLVDSNDLILDEKEQSAFLKKEGMSLDLGAVAKGYAVERAAQILEEAGIERAIINAGGNIRVIGQKAPQQGWQVGIQDPRDPQALIGILSLQNESAVTSGDYQRNKEIAGKTYHHLLSARTGYPAESMMNVTVVTKDSGEADLLSTALFLMEPEQALTFLTQHKNAEAVLITAENQILYTPGLKGKLKLTPGEEYVYEKNVNDKG
jgi:thiamine biosynthesis lipoprotein